MQFMKPISILLADDHRVIREGIRSYLEDDPQFEVIGEADSGEAAIEQTKTLQPDVILMDISMGGLSGIESTRQIREFQPDIKILALTMHNEPQYIRQMMDAGASGYLLKNSDDAEVKKAIKAVCEGEMYYSGEVTKIVMSSLTNKKPLPKAPVTGEIQLTSREREVLELILQEYSNQEIAEKLFISTRTVEVHKRNLIEKTGAKNLAGLVLYAISHNLVDNL